MPAHAVRGDAQQRVAHVTHEDMAARELGRVLGLERIRQVEPIQRGIGVVGHQAHIRGIFQGGDPQGLMSPQNPTTCLHRARSS